MRHMRVGPYNVWSAYRDDLFTWSQNFGLNINIGYDIMILS